MMNVFIGKYLCVQVISYGTLAGCCFKDLLVDNCCWLSGSLVVWLVNHWLTLSWLVDWLLGNVEGLARRGQHFAGSQRACFGHLHVIQQ